MKDPILDNRLQGEVKFEANRYLYNRVYVDVFMKDPAVPVKTMVGEYYIQPEWRALSLPKYTLRPNPPSLPSDVVSWRSNDGVIKGNGGIKFQFQAEKYNDVFIYAMYDSHGRYLFVNFHPARKEIYFARSAIENTTARIPDVDFTQPVTVEITWSRVSDLDEAKYTVKVNETNTFAVKGAYFNEVTIVELSSYVPATINYVQVLSEENPNVYPLNFDVSDLPNGSTSSRTPRPKGR